MSEKATYDMLKYERHYYKEGKTVIAGCDEVGRGPLAGPVVCCAVIMPLKKELIIEGVNDSKKLTEKKREELYKRIIEVATAYELSFVDQTIIDQINILEATKRGMKECINALKVKPDMILVDAVQGLNIIYPYQAIIKGDEKSYLIACASIVAKVTRDNYMKKMHEEYPIYNFLKHKGYGTKEHIEKLKEYGECELHRQTFIKNFK
ncbi:MAG: ribonuclease HII [Tenericutes bacterium HGW-Tenericutes-4]|nr:MAG: ribonuclease HII [Tenericutes bacterium HGW-Tenericutes-4]